MHDVDVDESNMISQDVDGDHIKSWVVERNPAWEPGGSRKLRRRDLQCRKEIKSSPIALSQSETRSAKQDPWWRWALRHFSVLLA
jgi:hypothetical protein